MTLSENIYLQKIMKIKSKLMKHSLYRHKCNHNEKRLILIISIIDEDKPYLQKQNKSI